MALPATSLTRSPAYGARGASELQGYTAPMGRTAAEKKMAIALQLMGDLGLTAEQAAGVVGNLAHESDNFTAFKERGVKVGGVGWAQWTASRRDDFFAFAKARGLDPTSDEANYQFLVHELTTSEADSLAKLRETTTPEQAATVFMKEYERPGSKQLQSRLAYADEAMQMVLPAIAGRSGAYPSAEDLPIIAGQPMASPEALLASLTTDPRTQIAAAQAQQPNTQIAGQLEALLGAPARSAAEQLPSISGPPPVLPPVPAPQEMYPAASASPPALGARAASELQGYIPPAVSNRAVGPGPEPLPPPAAPAKATPSPAVGARAAAGMQDDSLGLPVPSVQQIVDAVTGAPQIALKGVDAAAAAERAVIEAAAKGLNTAAPYLGMAASAGTFLGGSPVEQAKRAGQTGGPKAFWDAFYAAGGSKAQEAQASAEAAKMFGKNGTAVAANEPPPPAAPPPVDLPQIAGRSGSYPSSSDLPIIGGSPMLGASDLLASISTDPLQQFAAAQPTAQSAGGGWGGVGSFLESIFAPAEPIRTQPNVGSRGASELQGYTPPATTPARSSAAQPATGSRGASELQGYTPPPAPAKIDPSSGARIVTTKSVPVSTSAPKLTVSDADLSSLAKSIAANPPAVRSVPTTAVHTAPASSKDVTLTAPSSSKTLGVSTWDQPSLGLPTPSPAAGARAASELQSYTTPPLMTGTDANPGKLADDYVAPPAAPPPVKVAPAPAPVPPPAAPPPKKIVAPPPAAPAPAPAPKVQPSDDVMALQRGLNERGFLGVNGQPLAVDGLMGPQTQHALTAYNESLTALPVVGPKPTSPAGGARAAAGMQGNATAAQRSVGGAVAPSGGRVPGTKINSSGNVTDVFNHERGTAGYGTGPTG